MEKEKMRTKNKNKILLVAAALALTTALLLPTSNVFAASVDTGSTDATVSFTQGELTIESVPSIDFDVNEIRMDEAVYQAKSISNIVEISDLRGTGEG